MKVREINSTAEIDELERSIVASAEATAHALRAALIGTTGIQFLAQLKFEKAGRDPISDRALNVIEQVNQTFTYLASCDALRHLIAHHADRAPFVVHLGTAAGPDIESFDRTIVAEAFAATHSGSNGKLRNDLKKLRATQAEIRYLFYSCPGYDQRSISRSEHDVRSCHLAIGPEQSNASRRICS
jgi:hypothetical protein